MSRRLPLLVIFSLAGACATAKKPAADQPLTQAPKPAAPANAAGQATDPDALAGSSERSPDALGSRKDADEGLLKFPVVSFEFDSDRVTPEGREALDEFAARFRTRGEKGGLLIEGHADERGLEEYNLVLGEKRAASVRRYLSALGIPASAIRTISYGENRPLDPSRTEDAYAKNRRAEVHPIQ